MSENPAMYIHVHYSLCSKNYNEKEAKNMDGKVIPLGIDHGWSHIKTCNSCFVSGVAELGSEPMVYENILEYNGKYYRIGGERLKVQENKVCNENYYSNFPSKIRA